MLHLHDWKLHRLCYKYYTYDGIVGSFRVLGIKVYKCSKCGKIKESIYSKYTSIYGMSAENEVARLNHYGYIPYEKWEIEQAIK